MGKNSRKFNKKQAKKLAKEERKSWKDRWTDIWQSPSSDHPERQNIVSKVSEYAIIYKSELEFVSRCILDYPNIETGGQMFGYWMDDGTPVVLYTIGPGPHANHQAAFFNQDITYLETVGNVLTKKYGLQHMGEWHSHHQLGLAHPSGHDVQTMVDGIQSNNRNRFLLCIGNCTPTTTQLNPFNFIADRGTDYVNAQWVVKQMDSPFRTLIDEELRSMLYMPDSRRANYVGMESSSQRVDTPKKSLYESSYWLSDKSNNLILKKMMDTLILDTGVSNLKLMLNENRHVFLVFTWKNEYKTIITFPESFPIVPPKYKVYRLDWMGGENECEVQLPEWKYEGDLIISFFNYYNKISIL